MATKAKTTPTQRALNLWAVVLIIWAVYRAKVHMPEAFDEFVAKPIVFVLPVIYYISRFEKRKIFEALDINFKSLKLDILYGLAIGGVFFLSTILANMMRYGHILFFNNQNVTASSIVLVMALSIATAISEEIISRGFILKRLYEESKNIYTSSFFASILFFFLHVPMLFTNAKLSGNLLLIFMGTDLILSLTCSFIFLSRRSLTLPILIHAFYNLAIVFFL